MNKSYFEDQFKLVSGVLKKELNPYGYWTGQLSSSALATAVSIVVFKLTKVEGSNERIEHALNWLLNHVNKDGGYGDTPESESNVSTSLLSYSAIMFCCENDKADRIVTGIELYLKKQGINVNSGNIAKSILNFYGKDLTFSVPILSMLAICGILNHSELKKIPQLPFELALFPNSLYQFLNLQVVSYALPALIAVGIFLFKEKKSRNPILKIIRKKSIHSVIKKLEGIMPESGGFLEAIPLTAFTSMCLIVSGFPNHEIVKKALDFLQKQQRKDGSWAIDTDLSTWVTSLSIKALGPRLMEAMGKNSVAFLREHLIDLQYKDKHPFNQALPGAWGWTNYSGSVPDADDTPGAILALLEMYEGSQKETIVILQGCMWLTKIQNKDGGIPTFCKGWGKLPFDRSCADLTGHSILAWVKTLDILTDKVPSAIRSQINKSIKNALKYLQKNQKADGSWLPLWFGNQQTPNKQNPVYGTAKVGIYLFDCLACKSLNGIIKKNAGSMALAALEFIEKQQNNDGSWGAVKGTNGTIEETSLALSCISNPDSESSIKGFKWLENTVAINGFKSSPIGLYFSLLWYDEKMYPIVFYLESLRRSLDYFHLYPQSDAIVS